MTIKTNTDQHMNVSKVNGILLKGIAGLLIIVSGGVGFICTETIRTGQDVAAIKARQEITAQELSNFHGELRDHERRIGNLEAKTSTMRMGP